MRNKMNINKEWLLIEGKGKEIAEVKEIESWEPIDLPHTWNAIDGANGNHFHRGDFWYKKELKFSKEEVKNNIFIEFEGANSVTDVYLNERHIGQHRGGFSTFRFELNDYLKPEEVNIVMVKVDNSDFDDVYPKRADFTFFGGIYRDVHLIIVPSVHIDLMDHGSDGVYVSQKDVTEEKAQFSVKTKLKNSTADEKKVRVWTTLLNKEKQTIISKGQDVVVPGNSNQDSEITLTVLNPHLWNSIKDPYLYQLRVSIEHFNDTLDLVDIPVGLRYFSVDPEKGFNLNGKYQRLNGVSRHQDKKDKGWAIDEADQIEDMELIEEIGANAIRLAHYQHSRFFYDLCDEKGMVVWAEIPFITEMASSENPGENAYQQMTELIRQNYNHPSICFWGIMNEVQIDQSSEETSREIVQTLNKLTKQEDPYRETALANLFMVDNQDDYNFYTDLVGFNRYDGWYTGKTEDFAEWCDTYHAENPHVKLGITEYGAEGIIEYHSDQPEVKDYTEEYHALFHEEVWKIFEKRDFLWGTFVWNMFDFGANVRDEGGVKGRNNKGLVTYDRKVKKDAFFMYKAHWSTVPFIHVAGKRFIERVGEHTAIKVYTNCSEAVTISVNQQEISTDTTGNRVILFDDIPLSENENWITVKVEKNGQLLEDHLFIQKVAESPSYYKGPETSGESVTNWFEQPEFEEVEELKESDIPENVYSTKETLKSLMLMEETREAVISTLGDLRELPMFDMMKGMKLSTLASMDRDSGIFAKARVNKLNHKLIKIEKTTT